MKRKLSLAVIFAILAVVLAAAGLFILFFLAG
jgi:hypothetical protein